MSIKWIDPNERKKTIYSVVLGVILAAILIYSLGNLFSQESRCRNAKNGFAYNELKCSDLTGVDFSGNPIKK